MATEELEILAGADSSETDDDGVDAVNSGMPYSEFGGITNRLQEIQAAKAARLEGIRKMYDDNRVARAVLAEQIRPENTAREQKQLRNAAIANALGEGLAAIFNGIYAFSKHGKGYVPKGNYIADNIMARAERMKNEDIARNRDYNNLVSQLAERNMAERAYVDKLEYSDLTAEENALRRLQAQLARGEQASDLAEQRHKQLKERQKAQNDAARERQQMRDDAAMQRQRQRDSAATYRKQISTGRSQGPSPSMSAAATKFRNMQFRSTVKTTSTNDLGEVTTIERPYTPNRTEIEYADRLTALAAPLIDQYGFTPENADKISKILPNKYDPHQWQDVERLAQQGYSVEEIIQTIQRYKDK